MKTLPDFTPQDNKTADKDRDLFHIFEEEDIAALWAAYAAQRPLLVRGKPGTGKSQMAKAIAHHLGWAFVSHVIRGDTELTDLHYYFDAVARLGEAQAQGNCTVDRKSLDAVNFLSPGVFWWAYDCCLAFTQHRKCRTQMKPQPYSPKGWSENDKQDGVVLLIDEIDKANPDLPNGLLETIGDREFAVPYLPACDDENSGQKENKEATPQAVNPIQAGSTPLLIVITTNEERELPPAFVRRCFVHTLKMNMDPATVDMDEKDGYDKDQPLTNREQWLIERGTFRYGDDISEAAYREAARLLWKDRDNDKALNNSYPPGLAEYIDLLKVLLKVSIQEQAGFIKKISGYAFDKELEKDQKA